MAKLVVPSSLETGWRLGPYALSATGILSLGGSEIDIMPLQQKLLLILVQSPRKLIENQEIIKQLWPEQTNPEASRSNLTLAVHRLRQVFAKGPLGAEVIRAVYGKGYRLEAAVESLPSASPTPLTEHPPPAADVNADSTADYSPTLSQLFYLEAHDCWPSRDPYDLSHRQWLLRQSVAHDPSFSQGYLELCYYQLLQCFWGVRTSASALTELQNWLSIGDQQPSQAPGWAAIKAETMSLLLWQPQTTEQIYGRWLAPNLPPTLPRYSWARHLIFTGRPRQALRLLNQQTNDKLTQGWLLTSLAHCAMGDLKAAQQACQQQLRLNQGLVGSRLFLAMLFALQGENHLATVLLEDSGVLERPFQGCLALVAYALAQGRLHKRANQLLDEALARISNDPDSAGALGYWGLAALALDRSNEAIGLLKQSVRRRCYAAPVLLATPFLHALGQSPASSLFRERMGQMFVTTAKTAPPGLHR